MKIIMNMEINKNMKEKYYYLVNAVYIAKNFRVEYSYVAYKYTKYNKGNLGKKGSGNKIPKDNNNKQGKKYSNFLFSCYIVSNDPNSELI